MAKATAGNGMHRQFWMDVTCPHCGLMVRARRTLPGRPLHIRTLFDRHEQLCPPLVHGEVRNCGVRMADPDQLSLF